MRGATDQNQDSLSPLSHVIQRDGFQVRVRILQDDDGWLLEAIDEKDNVIVWDEIFESDQEALEEVLATIDDEGVQALIASLARGDE